MTHHDKGWFLAGFLLGASSGAFGMLCIVFAGV
jgi:hypothetical protein